MMSSQRKNLGRPSPEVELIASYDHMDLYNDEQRMM